MVVFYAGDNDIAAGKSGCQVEPTTSARSPGAVHRALPKTKVIFLAVKPTPARWRLFDVQTKANALVESFCKGNDWLEFVDVVRPMLGDDGRPRPELYAKDGLHLNEAGYKVWTDLLTPLLR